MFQVLTLPAKAVAQPFNGNTDLLKHAVFAKTGAGHFHKLVNLDRFATAMRAQGQAKRGGAFAFAVASVDDDNAATFALGFVVGFLSGWGFDLHGVQWALGFEFGEVVGACTGETGVDVLLRVPRDGLGPSAPP